jgi:hypothetical protein
MGIWVIILLFQMWHDQIKPMVQQKFSFIISYDLYRAVHRPALFWSLQFHVRFRN